MLHIQLIYWNSGIEGDIRIFFSYRTKICNWYVLRFTKGVVINAAESR